MWLQRPKRSLSDFGFTNVSGYADDPFVQAAVANNNNAYRTYVDTRKADARRQFGQAGLTAAGLVLGPAAFSAIGGGGSGAVSFPSFATEGVGFSAAPAATGAATAKAGTMATLGKIFSSPGLELGVNAGLNLYGQSQARKAADQARADQLAQYRESLALERQRLEMEQRNADLDRADAKALNDAINELKKRELDAAEEERAYTRSKDEAREMRLQPYRDISARAMNRLAGMWGI